jgi:2-methylcitrate dehydratase PrpD
LGKTWRIAEVAHKPFPSGRATHGIVDAIQELQKDAEINAAAITKVEARVPSLTNHLVGRPVHDAMEINYARLNGQYAAAVMLSRGFIGIDDFTLEAIRAPERVALARKVSIVVNDNPDPNALSPVEVDIHMADGTVHSKRIETVYGNPAKPMTRDAHLAKFRRNWESAACGLKDVDAEVMINRVDTLETVPDIRELIDLATG